MRQSPFITAFRTARLHVRQYLEEGATTSGFHADPTIVIQLLNAALTLEMMCIRRSECHVVMTEGIRPPSMATTRIEHAQAEQVRADQLMQRIVQLGGEPNVSPEGLLSRCLDQDGEEHSLPDLIAEDLMVECLVMESYRDMILYIGSDDPKTRRLLEHHLIDERKHMDELACLLGTLRLSSSVSSLSRWRTTYPIGLRQTLSMLWRIWQPSPRRGISSIGRHM
ncbi:MAG: hypothetical protein MRJ92_17170 [Nitrospira sp.]|nr:hypothetical protein [Nitrospira sp.]